MRIGIATDHGGFVLKNEGVVRLQQSGDCLDDIGANQLALDEDDRDYVLLRTDAVVEGNVEHRISICGNGVEATVSANKMPGARACLVHDHYSARQGVEDDRLNIFCWGGRTVGVEVVWDIVLERMSGCRSGLFAVWMRVT